MRYGLMFLMVLGGMLLAFQVPVNVRLRESLNSPILSAATSFFVGAVVLLLIVATGARIAGVLLLVSGVFLLQRR